MNKKKEMMRTIKIDKDNPHVPDDLKISCGTVIHYTSPEGIENKGVVIQLAEPHGGRLRYSLVSFKSPGLGNRINDSNQTTHQLKPEHILSSLIAHGCTDIKVHPRIQNLSWTCEDPVKVEFKTKPCVRHSTLDWYPQSGKVCIEGQSLECKSVFQKVAMPVLTTTVRVQVPIALSDKPIEAQRTILLNRVAEETWDVIRETTIEGSLTLCEGGLREFLAWDRKKELPRYLYLHLDWDRATQWNS